MVEQIEDVDLDDLNPESLWKFRVKGSGVLVSMDSHAAASIRSDRRRATSAAALASLGVKA